MAEVRSCRHAIVTHFWAAVDKGQRQMNFRSLESEKESVVVLLDPKGRNQTHVHLVKIAKDQSQVN